MFKQIIGKLYESVVPKSVKQRKNKEKAKTSDVEIISIYLLIQCLRMSINKGYYFFKNNFPTLVEYIERSRFNRLINSLMTVIRAIRRNLMKFQHTTYKIIHSFPLTTSKFGRAFFSKLFKGIASYGYCASKKEKYFGFKVHVIADLNGNPYDYVLTPTNVDDREAVFELAELVDIDILFKDKGYVGKFIEELREENGIRLYALKRSNSQKSTSQEIWNFLSDK